MAFEPILSKNFTFTYGGTAIGTCKDFTLDINKETIDVTTLDSDGWKQKLVDLKEWSFSFNALVVRGSDTPDRETFSELVYDLINTDTVVEVVFGDGGSGTLTLTGDCFITSMSLSGAVGDVSTYSGSAEGTNDLALVE